MWLLRTQSQKGCSRGTISNEIFLLQQMGCIGFKAGVHMMRF